MNKLGQRQSQTLFSSAFWVQKDFGLKKVSGPKKFWVQKSVGFKKNQRNVGPKMFESQQILGPKNCWYKKF